MKTYELINRLRNLPEDQRTEPANKLITQAENIDYGFVRSLVSLLPIADRAEFIKNHFDLLDNNPYLFSSVLANLPEATRLEFANQ